MYLYCQFLPQDLIIEVIYADIIHGKLDQNKQQLEIDYALGRDIRQEAVPEIVSVLQDWYVNPLNPTPPFSSIQYNRRISPFKLLIVIKVYYNSIKC